MPRVRVVAALGGLLAGVGIVTLLQQFAVTPLTATLAIIGIAGGIAAGLVLPNVMQMLSVMRINSAIASAESRLRNAISAKESSPPPPTEPA
jgi:hypothetical protein